MKAEKEIKDLIAELREHDRYSFDDVTYTEMINLCNAIIDTAEEALEALEDQ